MSLVLQYLISRVRKYLVLIKFYLLLQFVSMIICKENKSKKQILMCNNYKIAAMFALTKAPTIEDFNDVGESSYKILYISKNKPPLVIENDIGAMGINFIDLSDLDGAAKH